MKNKQLLLENLIYALIWIVVFVLPIFGFKENGAVAWEPVRHYWLRVLPFFALFLINNYFLLPFFFKRNRWWQYSIFTFVILFLLFVVLPAFSGIADRPMQPPHPAFSEMGNNHHRPPPPGGPPPLLAFMKMGPMLGDWLVAILIIGFNISIHLLFKSIDDERKIKELKNNTLQAELNYLKAQINPHFFMNTLNNIHALVDIDAEKAKQTVIELSKIMRYVLYDADQPSVPLLKETLFLENYVKLMRIRFTDDVEIQTSFPEIIPDAKIPPLLFVTLLENAFKHGISYSRPSFIHTRLCVENGQLSYSVENSAYTAPTAETGVGMANLRKRLMLIYGTNYSLSVHYENEKYTVLLTIPLAL